MQCGGLDGPWPAIVAQICGNRWHPSCRNTAAGTCNQVLNGGASASVVLPNMITNEDFGTFCFVINDTATTVLVFCAGRTMNGSSNGSLSVAAGATGIFVPRNQIPFSPSPPDWRGVVMT
jgi:hypothetical protein